MQYSVKGSDGNIYGPVDLKTIKEWVQDGRILPDTLIIDNLANITAPASQIPELGLTLPTNRKKESGGIGDTNNSEISGVTHSPKLLRRHSRVWGILFWLTICIVMAKLYVGTGLIVSAWNIVDAFKAKGENDPHIGWCFFFAIAGFLFILAWTIIRLNVTRA